MEIESKVVDKDQNVVVVKVKGRIITSSLDALENQLEILTKGKPIKLILDLQEVESIDSQGIGTLIKARFDIVNNAGKIVLAGLTDRVRAVLRVSGLEEYFLIAPDEQKALQLVQ